MACSTTAHVAFNASSMRLFRQITPIEPEFLAGTAHVSGIEVLA
jgi:hypothetical protein